MEFLFAKCFRIPLFPRNAFRSFGAGVVLKILVYSTLRSTLNIFWASLNLMLDIISRTAKDNCIMEKTLRRRTCFKKCGTLSCDVEMICLFSSKGRNYWSLEIYSGDIWNFDFHEKCSGTSFTMDFAHPCQ